MKNSGLFIGLGIGLLVGAAIGLYIAASDEDKAKLFAEIKDKAEDAKKSIGNVVKQGIEELDKAVEIVNQAAQSTISKIVPKSENKAETV